MKDISEASFLVTGGCGFVGTNLVRSLLEHGVGRCVVLDDLFTGEKEYLPRNDKVEFLHGSVTDSSLLKRALDGVEYVVHCAAVNIIAAQNEPLLDLEVNAGGTLKLLQAALACPTLKRLVYTSTASVYGNPLYLPIPEEARTATMSNYAVSKLTAENYVRVHYLLHDLPATVVRYSNVYGPFQSPQNRYGGVITKFVNAALRGEPLKIHGSGIQTRDFTYVEDAVEATLMAVLSPKSEGGTFNIATGREVSIRELAHLVLSILGREPNIESIDRRDIDNISRRCLNIEHIRTHLKWEPQFDIETGLERTLRWYQEQRDLAIG